jgi:hypothetical protein
VQSIEAVDLPAGDGIRVDYTVSAASTELHGMQLYVPVDGRTYVLTLSSREPIGELGDIVGDTLRVE